MISMDEEDRKLRARARMKSVGFSMTRIQPVIETEFDVWQLIKRQPSENTYNLRLKYRGYKTTSRRSKPGHSTIQRRRKHTDTDQISDSEGRSSVQSNYTEMGLEDHFFKDDYDFDAEEPAEPPLYPHLVHKPGTYAQELYLQACRHYGITHSAYLYKLLNSDQVIIKRHRLGPIGMKTCAIALMEMLDVHTLDVTDNNIGPQGATYVAELIKENNFIKHLNLSYNNLGGEGVQNLLSAITKFDCLVHLNLSGNGLGDPDAETVRPIIEDTHHLKELNLSHNHFCEAGGKIIGDALLWNDTIEVLDLSWNKFRRKGAIKIAEAIAKNLGVLTLNLSWNGLYLPGCEAIGKALEKNSTLTDLDLSSNRVDLECMMKLVPRLRKNTTLQTLRVSKREKEKGFETPKVGENPLTSKDITVIVLKIHEVASPALTLVDFRGQVVEESFLEVLKTIQTVRHLDVTYGRVRGADMDIHDPAEQDLLQENPLTVLIEFGKMIGIGLTTLFTALDKDGNKSLDFAEIKTGLTALNIPLSNRCIEVLIKRLDINNDGEIDFGELIAAQEAHKEELRQLRERHKTDDDDDRVDPEIAESLRVQELLERVMIKRLSGDSSFKRRMNELNNRLVKDWRKVEREVVEKMKVMQREGENTNES